MVIKFASLEKLDLHHSENLKWDLRQDQKRQKQKHKRETCKNIKEALGKFLKVVPTQTSVSFSKGRY